LLLSEGDQGMNQAGCEIELFVKIGQKRSKHSVFLAMSKRRVG